MWDESLFSMKNCIYLASDTIFESNFACSLAFGLRFSSHKKKLAKMVPEIECHTQDTAEAIAASAVVGKN